MALRVCVCVCVCVLVFDVCVLLDFRPVSSHLVLLPAAWAMLRIRSACSSPREAVTNLLDFGMERMYRSFLMRASPQRRLLSVASKRSKKPMRFSPSKHMETRGIEQGRAESYHIPS